MNCSASISGQSSYSITNHSNQCNQDVGVPIIAEKSSHIRNSSSSGKVIEQVEGQVFKNNNCVRNIDDRLRNDDYNKSDKISFTDRLIVGNSDNEDIYYDVLTQQKALLAVSTGNSILRIDERESNENFDSAKPLPHFSSSVDRQLSYTDVKHSLPLVLPNEDHIKFVSQKHHSIEERIDYSLKPPSCVPLNDSKIASTAEIRNHQDPSEYSFASGSFPSKCTNPKIYESMEMNNGIASPPVNHNQYKRLDDSPYNALMHESSIRASQLEIPMTSSTSPLQSNDDFHSREERLLRTDQQFTNKAHEQRIEQNLQIYPQSPSNEIPSRIPLSKNVNPISIESKERDFHYPLQEDLIDAKRVDSINSSTMESGKA